MEQDYRQIQEGLTSYVYLGTAIFLILVGLFVVFLIISMQKRKRMLYEKQQLEFQYQQELLRTQLEIQEQTFRNISQEIHDNIGQTLSLAKLNITTTDPDKKEEAIKKIDNSSELLSKAIRDLLDLSRSMNTDYVSENGLIRSIEYELSMINRTGSIEAQLQVEGTPERFDKQKELIIFRIVQETLNNIIKHADSKTITIKALYAEEGFLLTIKDEGKGFDMSLLGNSDKNKEGNNTFGLGLRNMHNRANLIGADFKIDSEINKGTKIEIYLPAEKR